MMALSPLARREVAELSIEQKGLLVSGGFLRDLRFHPAGRVCCQ